MATFPGSPGKTLLTVGGLMVLAGLLVILLEKARLPLGRLPGDIVIKGKFGTFYFPIVTCFMLSVAFSLLVWFLRRR